MSIFDELARSGGYYNARDMFDGGGAMARGGRFQGGGLLSLIGNLANSLAGRDMGERSAYFAKKPMQRPMPMQNNAVSNSMAPTSTFDAERMMAINNPIGNSFLARQDNPSGVGYGMANAPINSVADVASPINTAKVTPQQSQIQEIATNIVADEMGVGFFTAPLVERQRLVQNKINELTIAMGM